MMHRDWILFWTVGLVAVAIWAAVGFFSPSARLHRRRRKSHSPIKSTADRPTVRFSVRPPKKGD